MGTRRRVAGNLLWTWGGLAVGLIAGFVLAPFLIRHLGTTSYGIWVVIGSLTSYLGLFDLGTRGAVGRTIAFLNAKGDVHRANAVASTAMAILGAMACAVLVCGLVISCWLTSLFEIPPEQAWDARVAFVLVAATMAMALGLGVFDLVLFGCQRIGALSAIEMATDLTRLGVTFYVIGTGGGLLALGLISFATATAGMTAKLIVCRRLTRDLRLSPRLVTRDAAKLIFDYGSWNFVLFIGKMLNEQSGPLVIGARLGLGLVAPFSIAQRLVVYANVASMRSAEVFIPVAAALHAQEDRQRQQQLFLEGGRYSVLCAFFFVPAYILLGGPFIRLWIGPGQADGFYDLAALLLAVIILGEVIPLSQHVSRAVLLGMGRPRSVAGIYIVESVLTIATAVLVAPSFGLLGVVIVYAAYGTLGRGLTQIVVACRILHVPLLTYAARALLPALTATVIPAACLGSLLAWRRPSTWAELVAYGAVYGICYLLAAGTLVLGPRRMAAKGAAILRRLRGAFRSAG